MKNTQVYKMLKHKPCAIALSICVLSPTAWSDEGSRITVNDPWRLGANVEGTLIDMNGTLISAVVIDGEEKTVDSSTTPSSYALYNGGILNLIDGAVIDSAVVDLSTLNSSNGNVRFGIRAIDGLINLERSSVSNDLGVGIVLGNSWPRVNPGSTAVIRSSDISGVGAGIDISAYSELWLTDSAVSGVEDPFFGGVGIRLGGGIAHIGQGSRITGVTNGILIADGSVTPGGSIFELVNRLEIDSSTITSVEGAAIKVESPFGGRGTNIADISIKHNSQLIAGNGVLLEVEEGGEAKLEVDDSRLAGDLVSDANAVLDIVLSNKASLAGNIINANSLAINSDATWSLGRGTFIKYLSLNAGRVSFNGEGFHTLSLGELSGSGVFDMRINLDTAQGDLLEVNGQATGQHLLNVKNTGVEVVPAEFDPLRIVHTEGGDAQFGLIGNRVDLGAYSYLLEQRGNDWFIVGEGKTISPSTQSALALFNAGPAIWNSELTTLRSRMGEVRGQEQGGGWIRSYGNRFNASTGAGLNYQQKQQGLSFGADAPIPVGTGSLVMGLMGGYSKSDLDLSRGTSGSVDSYYIGAYGTWLFEDGYYLDGVLKFNKFRNESNVAMSDGSKAKGRYDNAGVGGSVEFGKHIKLADDYFVEPYTQLSGVSIGGDRYLLDNGMTAKSSRTQSILGKVGTTAGRNFTLEDGSVVQPYVRVAMAHEFTRSNDVTVNETRFDNNLFGSRAELGAGVAVSLSKRVQLHADFDYMKGEHVEQPWGANLGLKIAF